MKSSAEVPLHTTVCARATTMVRSQWVRADDWLLAGLNSRGDNSGKIHQATDGITVIFDGYLSDFTGQRSGGLDLDRPAATLAALYRIRGTDFVLDLRGSFVALIVDAVRKVAWLFNDRRASRSHFYRADRDGLWIAPEIRLLAVSSPYECRLDIASVGSFLTRGINYGGHTLFQGIRALPYGSLLEIRPNSHCLHRYWRIQYQTTDTADDKEVLEEADALLRIATRRVLRVFQRPILSLSGGIDSRIILAYLQQELGAPLTTVSYGRGAEADNDMGIARRLAREFSLDLREQRVGFDDYPEMAITAMQRIDGRVDVLDAPGLVRAWDSLEDEFDVALNGDQCFGWKGPVSTQEEALESIGRWGMDAAPRASSWLRRAHRTAMRQVVETNRAEMIEQAMQSDCSSLKDALFWQESACGVAANYAARRLPIIEQARPLLDEDVMDFIVQQPAHRRWNKSLLHRLMEQQHPELHRVPYAQRSALDRPKEFVAHTRASTQMVEFFQGQLGPELDEGLANLFETDVLQSTLHAVLYKRPLPPLRSQWLQRIPVLGRLAQQPTINEQHPLINIRRIVAMNLYLRTVKDDRMKKSRAKLVETKQT